MRTPLIFLDTETLGLRPDLHCPWEIAWITAIHDSEEQTLTRVTSQSMFLLVSDTQMFLADPVALKIGRFAERFRVEEAVWPEAALVILRVACRDVSTVCGDPSVVPHLVGAVPSFDHAMICSNLSGWPDFGEGMYHYHLVDVEALAAGRCLMPPPWNSNELTARYDVEVDEAVKHTAAGDADWAMRLYAAVYLLEIQ